MLLAAPPLAIGLLATFAAGLLAGAAVNWAVYALAWNRRPISPWSPAHADAPPRRVSDSLPIWGWFGLRRESPLHGRGFWLRPLAVELAMAFGWAALYWWEVDQQGLLANQFEAIARNIPAGGLTAPFWTTLATFLAHALLATLMAAASLIDVDEKTIPDGVTVPGTLLALMLATALPMSLLPQVSVRAATPLVGAKISLPAGINLQGANLYVEPVSLVSPNAWPAWLGGSPNWESLAIGLACFASWRLALTPRVWRGQRGMAFGLRVMTARVVRELLRPRSALVTATGSLAIIVVWFRGGPSWLGLLSALFGLVGGGAMVWAVRIVGSAALRREAMGFGDVTLMMMIGAFLGWQAGIFIFFIAPFAGLVVGLVQLILRRDDVIPYGPFLCLGTLAVMIRWADFWNIDPRGFQVIFQLGWLIPAVLAIGVVMLGAMLVIWRNIKESLFGTDDDED